MTSLQSQPNCDSLLVELLTEELPPKALTKLANVFSNQVRAALDAQQLTQETSVTRTFATPRRLAFLISHVKSVAGDRQLDEKLMPVSVGFDAEGKPTAALIKKMQAKGIPDSAIPSFEKRLDGKAEALFYRSTVAGASLSDVLADIVTDALKKLPIPKLMHWGANEALFVRPVHGLMMLHGATVIAGSVLGLSSSNKTKGHRFLSTAPCITIDHADQYETVLSEVGHVMVCPTQRKQTIDQALLAQAKSVNASIQPSEDLLNEVTALVEWPAVYIGSFEAEFLEVPQECLILTMQQNQKYFPLFDEKGALINRFLIVSNMDIADPRHIVEGNARVVRPRLSDARFFFNQDRKTALASRLDKLSNVVYHNKLGSVLQRVDRLETLAQKIAVHLGANASLAARAARLAKADLVSEMVGEFPELQGIMGRYYALHDGEDSVVADAIQSHYQPRFAGDALPEGTIACAVALADKLDALTGFFGIGQIPTGDKDPFGLRRAALGILRILIETPLPLDLSVLIEDAMSGFSPTALTQPVKQPLFDFMLDRLRGLLREAEYSNEMIESVVSQNPTRIDLVIAKLQAVRSFFDLDEAPALAAANKRIGNILKKNTESIPKPSSLLLQEEAEKALFGRVQQLAPQITLLVAKEAYTEALQALATVRDEVDLFFDKVMVNVEDNAIRANRLALLQALYSQLNAVADISKLSL